MFNSGIIFKNLKDYKLNIRKKILNKYNEFIFSKQKLEFKKLYSIKADEVNCNKQRILFWIPGGMPKMLEIEGAIAAALKLRGHIIHCVICDGSYTACNLRSIDINQSVSDWKKDCKQCKKKCESWLQYFGVPYSFIGDYVDAQTREYLKKKADKIEWDSLDWYNIHDIDIGKNIKSSIMKYLQGQEYTSDKELLAEYSYSGLVSLFSAQNIFEEFMPDKVFMSHGVYIDWGAALKVAYKSKKYTIGWGASYLFGKYYFGEIQSPQKIAFSNISDSVWNDIKNQPLSKEEQSTLNNYFENRYIKGIASDIKEYKKFQPDVISDFRIKYKINNQKKTWAILAHVNWDAVADCAPMLFKSINDWIIQTISFIKNCPGVNWLIKIHPAEAQFNPLTGIQKLIADKFSHLPDNIKIIGYHENINSFNFYELIDGAITIYGTPGCEIAYLGKPVIVTGEAHYSRKGFTYDPKNINEYEELLKNISRIPLLSECQKTLAGRYLYMYFIRRQVPFPPVYNPYRKGWRYEHQKREYLLPGKNKYVDFICDRILDGREFIMPDELLDS